MSVYQELGAKLRNFMLDKTEEVDDKVEAIDKHERYVNTDLDSCFCKLTKEYEVKLNEWVPFDKVSGTFEVRNNRIVIKPKQRIQISVSVSYAGTGNKTASADLNIKDYTNNIVIAQMNPHWDSNYEYDYTQICQYTNDTDVECEIGLYINQIWQADTMHVQTTMSVQEIGRQIVIDPVEHVNDSQGIEDTPVGHIIAHMGTVAPKHYLICDGAEYNITDYPYLAQHIEDNFGSINFFGGDGETTFAVPDLRGEFLRGTGTGTRDTGSGANVGQHQNGTIMPNIWLYHNTNQKWQLQAEVDPDVPSGLRIANGDKYYAPTGSTRFNLAYGELNLNKYTGAPDSSQITVRPTNTSVLYCIKYEPTYFMNTYNTNYMQPSIYSEEERIIGCWVNGKPLYEKVFYNLSYTAYSGTWTSLFSVADLNIDEAICINGKRNKVEGFMPQLQFDTNGGILSAAAVSGSHPIFAIVMQYTKTTDEENSFTESMLKESYIKLDSTCTDEELQQAILDMVEEINAEEVTPEVIDEPETELAEGGQGQ